MSIQDGKLQWHPAFSAALHIEFEKELMHLEFYEEYQLSRQPMRIDIMIIKKIKDVHIQKNIGRIFRTYNIIEYKSPEDSLNINDFYKVYGYACFFQSDTEGVCEINPDDITITYVSYHYPMKMIKYLVKERDMKINKQESGIYYISGSFFQMQLLVTRELKEEENFWLSYLRKNLKHGNEVRKLLEHYEIKKDSHYHQAVMNLIVTANKEQMEEEWKLFEVLHEMFPEEFKKSEDIGEIRGKKQGIQLTKTVFKLSLSGVSTADIARQCNITEDYVKEILE